MSGCGCYADLVMVSSHFFIIAPLIRAILQYHLNPFRVLFGPWVCSVLDICDAMYCSSSSSCSSSCPS